MVQQGREISSSCTGHMGRLLVGPGRNKIFFSVLDDVNMQEEMAYENFRVETISTISTNNTNKNNLKRNHHTTHKDNNHIVKSARPAPLIPAIATNALPPPISLVDCNPVIEAVPRFFYNFHIGHVEVTALMDGGAMINCINKEIMDDILMDNPTIIVSFTELPSIGTADANGTLKVIGRVQLLCYMGKTYKPVTFAICQGLSQSMILGRPFYRDHVSSSIEKPPVMIFNDGWRVSLTTQPDRYKGEIMTVTGVTVLPGTTKIIVAKINQPMQEGTLGLVTPLSSLFHVMPDSINYIRKAHNVLIKLTNPSYLESVEIKSGEIIGTFEGVPRDVKVTEVTIQSPYFNDKIVKQAWTRQRSSDNASQMSSIDTIPIVSTGRDSLEPPHDSPPRISSLGCAGSGGEEQEAVQVDDRGDRTPSSITEKGGLPWGMLDPGWSHDERALVVDMLNRVQYAGGAAWRSGNAPITDAKYPGFESHPGHCFFTDLRHQTRAASSSTPSLQVT